MTSLRRPRAFETMRTYQGRVRALSLHLERLFRSWRALFSVTGSILNSHEERYILQQIDHQLESWGVPRSAPLTVSTRGVSISNHIPIAPVAQEQVIRCWLDEHKSVTLERSKLDRDYVGRPIHVGLSRLPFEATLPRVAKHDARQAWNELARESQVDELLFLEPQYGQWVLEAHNSNVWMMTCSSQTLSTIEESLVSGQGSPLRGTVWSTPPLNGMCLGGVTRLLICDLLRRTGAEVIEESIEPPMITREPGTLGVDHTKQERFYYLSSTLKSLSPIYRVDQIDLVRPHFDRALCAWVDQGLRVYT